jgi:hypothetical protein
MFFSTVSICKKLARDKDRPCREESGTALPVLTAKDQKNRSTNFMSPRRVLLLTAVIWANQMSSELRAQEAVSTTADSGTAMSSIAGSPSGTTAPPTGVTSSTGGPAVETAPSGPGAFSPTPVQIYATVSGGYDDNVNTGIGSQKQASPYTNGNAILAYAFGNPRLQLNLNAGAGGTYYYEHISGQNYDVDFKGAFGITYKSTPRLTLGCTLLVEYLTEPSFDYAGGLNSRNGNYLYTTDKVFVDYAWSRRFSTKTSETFEAYNYDNDAVGMFSNRVTNILGNEFRFQLVPTTTLVAEYRYTIVSYENGSLDSTTHTALGGFDHIFNPRLRTSIRGGAEFRSYDNDGERNGPYFEGTTSYAFGRRTSISWSTRYGLEEPDVPTAQSRTTFRTGLQTKFNFTSRIASTVDLYYVHDDFHPLQSGPVVSTAFSDDTFDGGVTLRYNITPLIGVQVGYHYTDVNSDVGQREYSRNRVFGGANVTF